MWILPKLTADEILIYLRKSRTDDPSLTVEEVLAKHEQMLNEWVQRNLPDIGSIPEDNRYREIVSGETIDSRPKVQGLLRRAESPKIKAILIVEPQRLSRGDLEDIGRLVKLLRYSNTIVITLQYTYDLRDERDRDMFERELKRGNEFLEYQKRIMNNGRLLAVENGNYLGTWPPYGYKKVVIKEGKKKYHTLEPIPEQAAIVKLIFEMYRDGYGSHKIARELNKMGVPTAKGGKWSAESLKRMRTNEHYLGKVVWNRRRDVRSVEDGEVVVHRPLQEEYLVFPGKQPAIIEQDLWDAVQVIRDKIPPVKGRARCVNPLAGLVYCKCGRAMSYRTYKNKGVERSPARLLCDDQTSCKTASCYYHEMQDSVVKVLRETIEDFELKIKNNAGDSQELHKSLVSQHESRLEELAVLEVKQWEDKYAGKMPEHIFETLNEKLLAERETLQQALCTLRESMPEPIDYEIRKKTFQDALDLLLDDDAPALKKNLLLKNCIEKIVYDREMKKSGNRRYGDPEPIKLNIHLKV